MRTRKRTSVALLAGLCALAAALGCARGGASPAAVGVTAPPAVAPEPREAESSRGTFHVAYKTAPDAIATNQPFDLIVEVREGADHSAAAEGTTLEVDAKMVEHNHGMNVQPKVTHVGGGSYRVEGMLFHMTGPWELYLDVTREGITERAAFNVTLR